MMIWRVAWTSFLPEAMLSTVPRSRNGKSRLVGGPPLPRWVLPAIVVTGIGCRVIQYAWNLSFWGDEASVVLNIRGKTAAQLLGPLNYQQAVPPLLLLAERAIYRVFGGSEFALRLLPLICGCAAIVCFAVIARRLFTSWPAVVAVALFAWSDRLSWHTVEVKQYGIDVFIACVLTLIGVGRSRDEVPVRRLIELCAFGAVAVWCSYPAVFVFGGLSLAMLPTFARKKARGLATYAIANLLVVISFLLLMRMVERAQHTQYLDEFWATQFLDLHHPFAWPAWLAAHLFALCNYPLQPAGVLVLPCAVAGAIGLARTGRYYTLAILLNPLALNLAASALHRYPFDGGRLTLYLTVDAYLLAAAGTLAIYRWLQSSIGAIAVAPGVLLVILAAVSAVLHVAAPRQRGNIRPVVAYVRSQAGPDDGIYTPSRTAFYAYWDVGDRLHTDMEPADEIPFKRFWIVWSNPSAHERQRLERVRAWADTFAEEKVVYERSGDFAYRFEMKPGPRPHSQERLNEFSSLRDPR
jgi:hypothetical protein